MFGVTNITAAQASDYYKKDNYYLREGGGEWFGTLKEHFGLPDRVAEGQLNELVQMHEKFRTFDVKFILSRDLEHLKRSRAFTDAHRLVIHKVLDKMEKEIKEKTGHSIKFKRTLDFKVNSRGNISAKAVSFNVAVNKCPDIEKALKSLPFRQEYRNLMLEEMKKLDHKGSGKQFNLQVVENSGRVGFDLTFSAPKSVSIAMTINDQYHNALKEAHDKAVRDSLEYIQRNLIEYRQGREAKRIKSNDVLIAKMDHLLSRLQDPQLHSHCILFNTCRGEDGKFRSISNEQLYNKQKLVGIGIYKSQLAHYVRKAGFDIEVGENGQWELKGITRDQIQAFSTRWQEIHNYIDEHGLDHQNPRDREIATLATRMKKENHNIEHLKDLWSEVRCQHGISEETFTLQKEKDKDHVPNVERLEKVDREITDRSDTFSKEDYLARASDIAIEEGLSLEQVEEHFEEQLQYEEFVPAGPPSSDTNKFFTHREIKIKERKIFERVEQGVGLSGIRIPEHRFRPVLKSSSLTKEQQAAVEHIVTAHDRFSAINGVAGAGKTHLLKETRNILEAEGYKIQGLAFTGKAASKLEQETGIPSRTIHSYMRTMERTAGYRTILREGEIQNDWNLTGLSPSESKEVWLVDEANMLNVNLMDYIQRAAISRQATVVFIGDYRQLQPIGGGNAFSHMILEDRIDYFDLRTSFRQRNAPTHIREAVHLAAEGSIGLSLRKLEKNIIEIESKPELMNSISRIYAGLPLEEQKQTIIIAGTNRDRVAINAKVRERLKARGMLEEGVNADLKDREGKPIHRELCPGDRIMFFKNNHELDICNGQTASITEVSPFSIAVETNNEKREIVLEEYPYIDHYYACTTWKAEGESFKNVMAHIDTHQHNINSREDFFVRISRAKENILIFTDDRYSLLESISHSKIPGPIKADSLAANRLLLLSPNVRHLLTKGTKWSLIAAHYDGLDRFQSARPRSSFEPIAKLQTYFRSYRSQANRARTKSMDYYDRAIEKYKDYLDHRISSTPRKEAMLQSFVHHYVPQSSKHAEIPLIQMDPAERKRLLDQFFEPIDLMFDAAYEEFTRNEYINYAMDMALEGEAIRPEIEAHFDDLIENRFFQPRYKQTEKGEQLFGPNLAHPDENQLVRRVRMGVGQSNIRISPRTYRPVLQKSPLTSEQRQAAEFILSSGDQTIALNGVAGSGKTRLVKDVCDILKDENYVLHGLSFTGKAAYNLSLETGINCSTMHSHFGALERKAGNPPPELPPNQIQNEWNFTGLKRSHQKEVWFVDEANMLSDKLMDHLQRAAAMRGATVILMGDYRQLQPIDKGNPYTYLIQENKIDYFDLKTSFRQQNALTNVREAVDFAAAEKIEKSLKKLQSHTIEIPDTWNRCQTIARHFTNLTPEDRNQSVIICGTNVDRRNLNNMVRQNLKQQNELSDGRTLDLKTPDDEPIEREMSKNDRIIFLRNDKSLGLFNGQTGTITNIDENKLTIKTPEKTLTLDTQKYPYLDHFYACTTWKAEGDSYKKVLLHINIWQRQLNCRQDYYVKISRAKYNLTLYSNDKNRLLDEVSKFSLPEDYAKNYETQKSFDLLDQKIQYNLSQASRH